MTGNRQARFLSFLTEPLRRTEPAQNREYACGEGTCRLSVFRRQPASFDSSNNRFGNVQLPRVNEYPLIR